jgi:hypothetical protein
VAVNACLGVGVALGVWAYFGEQDTRTDIWLPALSALVTWVVFEGIRLLRRYVWAVPEQEHVDAWREIDQLTISSLGFEEDSKGWMEEARKADNLRADANLAQAKAIEERNEAVRQRDQALRERDAAVSAREASEAAHEAFDLALTVGGPIQAGRNEDDPKRRFYVVVRDVMITNKTDAPVPIEPWLRIDVADTHAVSFVAKYKPLSAEYVAMFGLQTESQLHRPTNVFARASTPVGYLVFAVESSVLEELGTSDPRDISRRPLWLEMINKVTEKSVLFALNVEAIRVRAQKQLDARTPDLV